MSSSFVFPPRIFSLPYVGFSAFAITSSVFFCIPSAGAQELQTDQVKDGMEYFVMEDFVVVADDQIGYVVTNSTSGTRLNQPVKELPMPIEIISSDFIEDTGAESLGEALAFSAGLETNLTSTQSGDGNTSGLGQETSFRLRGLVQEAALRNGFRRIGGADTFNISRVDVVRGPNALLYGVGNFGGVVNYITRRPSGTPRYKTGFAVSSNDSSFRWNGEATGPITEKIGYSLSMFAVDAQGRVDHSDSQRFGIAPVLEWKPFESTTISLDFEYVRRESDVVEGYLGGTRYDQFAENLQTGETERVPYVDNNFPNTGVDISNTRGYFRFPGSPDDDTFRYGSDGDQLREDTTLGLNLIQKFGEKLSFQAGFSYSESSSERLGPGFSLTSVESILSDPTSERAQAFLQGNPWINPVHPDHERLNDPFGNVIESTWRRTMQSQERYQFRLEAAYQLPINESWYNSFVAGVTYNLIENSRFNEELYNGNNFPLGTDDPNFNWTRQFDNQLAPSRFQSIYDTSVRRLNLGQDEFFASESSSDLADKFREEGAYFIHQGKFFKNRIRTVTGYRYDQSGVRRAEDRNIELDNGATVQDRFLKDWQDAPSETNFSFGVSAQLSEDSPWAIYYLTAGAVRPEFGRFNVDGTVIAPTTGQSQELGFKFDVKSKKTGRPLISGTAAVYEVIREGVVVGGDGALVAPESDSPDFAGIRTGQALRDDESKGMDMQIIFTDLPIKNLQTIFNFSYNDYSVDRLYGLTYEDPVPDDPQGLTDPIFFEKDLSSAIDFSRRNNGTPEFSAKMWSKYEFKEGTLKGFNIAGGVRWVDERESLIGTDDTSFQVLPPLTTYDFAMGYKNRFREIDYSIRLNVSNVADDERVYGTGFRSGRSYRLAFSASF